MYLKGRKGHTDTITEDTYQEMERHEKPTGLKVSSSSSRTCQEKDITTSTGNKFHK
jgi:hypothetical protein